MDSDTTGGLFADTDESSEPQAGVEEAREVPPVAVGESLEASLQEHEADVDALLKDAVRYVSALKAWKKAARQGQTGARQRAAEQAARMAAAIEGPVKQAADWSFDVAAWLRSPAWHLEIAQSLRALGLAAIEDPSGALLCPPLPLVAEPERGRVRAGRQTFSALRPSAVAAEIKRLRDRVAGARTQEYLEALYAATRHMRGTSDLRATFREVYSLFALTPGWKKENTELDFGQMIYALSVSGLQTTRDGKRFQVQIPSGKVKQRDIFGVYGEDGRLHQFYAIRFY